MRLVVLLSLMCAAVGCSQQSLDGAPPGVDGSGSGVGGGGGGAAPECVTASDCAARGANCCDCPTFAVLATDPGLAACGDVSCPMMDCPNDVAAACQAGQCVLACKPVTCTTSCASGFVADSNGCLTCACATAPGGGSGNGSGSGSTCTADTDCVRTRADCCGCAHGGSDTAVLASDQASFDASLMCSANPQCPSTDTCSPDLQPRCVAGTCQLAAALPPNACGRPDLPACPMGQTCTLNASDAATAQGVGVCQ